MPFSNIDKPSKYFNTITYTGTGASLANTGVGFQPDWVWIKGRSGATDHGLYDAVRGVQKDLVSNATSAETTQTTGLTAFGSDGFTIGALAKLNTSAATYVAWNWLGANTTVSNTAGSITSTVSANTTSGFSIVNIPIGSVSGTQTFGHGLGVAPKFIIYKVRGTTDNWSCYHASLGATQHIELNLTNAAATSSAWFANTAPTSTVATIACGGANWFYANQSYIAYCFAEVKGYSKFGGYTGNGGTGDNGVFVYTGFKPAFVMFRATNYGSATRWIIKDNKRNTYNVVANNLTAELAGTENTDGNDYVDFLSNGFKYRGTTISENINASGTSYIYMAFAENPFVSSKGIPTCAR